MDIGEDMLTRVYSITHFCNQTISAPLSYAREVVAACVSQGTFNILLRMCGNINEQQL
jgi:hypothetical protein